MAGSTGKNIELFALKAPYYLEGSPVIISSGSLLMDRFSEKETVRLVLKNITDTGLLSCEVKITLFDAENNPYEDEIFFRYEGMKVPRDGQFGGKKQIPLPDNRVRSFSVLVTEVILGDYTHWKNEASFAPIDPMQTLEASFNNGKMAEEYAARYGNDCRYMPSGTADLWYCTCGAVNHISESRCYKCGRSREALGDVNERSLKRGSEERARSEQFLKEEEQRKKARQKKIVEKILKVAMIVLPVLLIAAVILATVPPLLERQETYAEAERLLAEGSFAEAQEMFLSLGDYKDAKDRAEKDVPYERAVYVLNCAAARDSAALKLLGLTENDLNGSELDMFLYGKAKELFSAMDGYRESNEKLAEIDAAFNAYDEQQRKLAYDAACALLEKKAYLQAREAFLAMNGYLDSKELAEECLYRRACGVLDFCESTNARGIYLSVSDSPDVPTAISMRGSALATIGSEKAEELRACFQGDGVNVYYEDVPGSSEESAGRTYLPVCEAAQGMFRALNGYLDTEERIARAEKAGDFTAPFYALLENGDLDEAVVWLNTYDDDVPERESVRKWAEEFAAWRRYWTFSSGDSTLIPFSAGRGTGEVMREFSSKVCIIDGNPVLYLEQIDGEYVVKMALDVYSEDYIRFASDDGENFYYARIAESGCFVYMRYLGNGTMSSISEYRG